MPVKIRLQRHGKKGYAYFHIVAADSRSKRDGRAIERIGTYNPNTNPATILLDNDAALRWLNNGAQPTDTARAILSYKGVLYKQHLLKGVDKGALTLEQAEAKWHKWADEKEGRVQAKRNNLSKAQQDALTAKMAAERAVNEVRMKEAAAKLAAAEAAAAPAIEEEIAAEPVAEVVAEPMAEVAAETAVEVAAEPVAEVVAEPTVETEPVAEVAAETAAEETAPEAPATDEEEKA